MNTLSKKYVSARGALGYSATGLESLPKTLTLTLDPNPQNEIVEGNP